MEVLESARDKRISLRTDTGGKNAKELIGAIARDIDAINRGFHFNERMRVEQKIPCNCAVCKGMQVPHYFLRSNLDRAESAGSPVQCQQSFEMVNVRELLDGVFAEKIGREPDHSSILERIERGELRLAFEAMKGEYPEVSGLLGSLSVAEKEYRDQKIDFKELAQKKARLSSAALDMLGPEK
ncbi:MAG: hypothetical protein JNJ90_17025 [Saprospiraceae bacterium]|nr:hypothetical protein [Saprospiraceae bacterium]